MRKAILVIAVALMAVAMLATPLIGMASAGTEEKKLSFRLVIIGTYSPPERTLETQNTLHYFNLGFRAFNPLTSGPYAGKPNLVVEINGQSIPLSRLSFTGLLHININEKNGVETVQVTDIITIKDANGNVMGNIEIQAMGQTNMGNGVGEGNSFQGHGTDNLAGVKVQGETISVEEIGEFPVPGRVLAILRVERVGIIMGW